MATYPDIGLQPHAEKMKEIAHAGWATRCCGAAASGTPAAAVVDRYRPFVCVAEICFDKFNRHSSQKYGNIYIINLYKLD